MFDDYTHVNIQLLDPTMPVPRFATSGSAGIDLTSTQKAKIEPGTFRLLLCGFCIELPRGYEAQIRPRSGHAMKHGVTVLNSPGTIDSDYRGEVGVLLVNLGTEVFIVNKYDRIAQMVIAKLPDIRLNVVDRLQRTERAAGGFGSTGTR